MEGKGETKKWSDIGNTIITTWGNSKFILSSERKNTYSSGSTLINSNSAAAAESLQSCLTLCDPIDGSPPGSPVPGILQARTLEWVAISFSNAKREKWKGSRSVVSNPQRPHGLQPTRLLHPWDFPGKSTGVGCHCLFPNSARTMYSKYIRKSIHSHSILWWSVSQFKSVTQSCPTLCDTMDCSMPGFAVHHQFPELPQTHVHQVGDAT